MRLLAEDRVDYTIFWRRLSHHAASGGEAGEVRDLFLDRAAVDGWLLEYASRMKAADAAAAGRLMLQTNPKYVLRNHLGELAIRQAKLGDFSMVTTLLQLLQSPFEEHPAHQELAGFPPDWASQIEISCSS